MDEHLGLAAFRQSLASLAGAYGKRDKDWALTPESPVFFPPARGSKGARPLMCMCLRVVAENMSAISKSMIGDIKEDKLLWKLWEQIPRRVHAIDAPMSLHAWEILSYWLQKSSFSDAWAIFLKGKEQQSENLLDIACKRNERGEVTIPMAMYRYRQQINSPDCGLSVYTSPLHELTDCLVYLCIDNADFDTYEMLSLARLKQLAVLELIERDWSDSQLSDSMIRGWSEVAAEIELFPELRVLRIASDRHQVTEASLHYVLKFPKLEIFDVTEAYHSTWDNATQIAEEFGWKITHPMDETFFVSCAMAYLDQRVAIREESVRCLIRLFEDDEQGITLIGDPQAPTCEGCKAVLRENLGRKPATHGVPSSSEPAHNEAGHGKPDLVDNKATNTDLDDSWQTLLQGNHPFLPAAIAKIKGESNDSMRRRELSDLRRREMTDGQVFWLLGLFDQREFASHHVGIQAQVEGIALPRKRFASIRLHHPSTKKTRGWYYQLVFSRTPKGAKDIGKEPDSPQQAPRPHHLEERKETNLKPRKRQKLGDVLSSLGVPHSKSG
ncbi:hypothetical protein C8A03DRAFT_10902 [Achaetomium macrosporum]|uniref:Uncharacterized protein n=1 Tax=Achaetomium macrosporum TaxID=79813 RepID=A0AAN7CKS4_9PEZI|nr:hypothetical protein C8A03DRAFT_10902 [Achaetomium macrosporum]